MLPVLFSFGSIVIYSGSIFLILSWMIASFVFWRNLRDEAIPEEKIFDCMFYITIVGVLSSRLGYVLLHWADFHDNLIKIFALWIAPGLWFYSGLFGSIFAMFILSSRLKVRLSYMVDAIAVAIALSGIVASIGMLFEGSEVGKITAWPLRVLFVGHPGLRHPYGLYESMVFLFLTIGTMLFSRFVSKRHLPYGTIGIVFFVFFSVVLFMLEYLKDSPVYLRGLSVNQWVLMLICTQAVAALWVRLRLWSVVRPQLTALLLSLKNYYDAISKRSG